MNSAPGDATSTAPSLPGTADELLPLVYEELRRMAAQRMARESPGQTLQATALVHEAWIRLHGDGDGQWNDRAHFFRAAADAMRRILIDTARSKGRQKRDGGQRIDFSSLDLASDAEPEAPPVVATLFPPDSEWKWLHPTDGVDPATNDADFHTTFFAADYDDAVWKTGKDSADPSGGFGYGRGFTGVDIGTPEAENHRHSAYFRHRFTTDKPHASLELRCQRDDALIVYLDGNEVLRDNLTAGPDTYLLSAAVPQKPDNDGVVHRFQIPGTLAPGEHLIAISVHNTERPSADLRLGGVTLVETGAEAKPRQEVVGRRSLNHAGLAGFDLMGPDTIPGEASKALPHAGLEAVSGPRETRVWEGRLHARRGGEEAEG